MSKDYELPVERYKLQMLKNLRLEKNANKRHWLRSSYTQLLQRLKDEVQELEEVLKNDKVPFKHKKIIRECADIGNFGMMIADKAENGAIF